MGFLVCCVFAYWLMKHLPEIAEDTAAAVAAGLSGEESPATAARRQRLVDAGIDPATGGAFRQFAGNVLRDFWLDQDTARAERRVARRPGGSTRGAFGRIRDRFDDLVDEKTQAWRNRNSREQPDPGAADTPVGNAGSDGDSPEVPTTDPASPAGSTSTDEPADDVGATAPLRVPSSLGASPAGRAASPVTVLDPPLALPAPTERNPTMSQAVATNQTAVTGVVSGAAEARSIQRYLESATEAYETAMSAARKRIHALGEQTVGVVQMATKSTVVDATAQAAESIAAAQAGANRCKAETIPLLGHVAREFDKRNS